MASLPMVASGGGAMTPTVLWTNPNATAAWTSSSVTLSEDMNNYRYIEVEVYRTRTNHNEIFKSGMYLVSDVVTFSGNGAGRMSVTFCGASNNVLTRNISYVSDTSLTISACYQFGSGTSDNNANIPYRVVGYK